MNQNSFFNKWWLLLLQGVLLMMLSYAHFNDPVTIVTVANITGFITLLTGCSSVVGYFLTDKIENNRTELMLGVLSCVLAVLFIAKGYFDKELIIWLLVAYMLINGCYLINITWQVKAIISWWWLSILILGYTFLMSFYIISGILNYTITISLFVGFQFFGNGLLLVLIALVMRKLQHDYCQTISQIKHDGSQNLME